MYLWYGYSYPNARLRVSALRQTLLQASRVWYIKIFLPRFCIKASKFKTRAQIGVNQRFWRIKRTYQAMSILTEPIGNEKSNQDSSVERVDDIRQDLTTPDDEAPQHIHAKTFVLLIVRSPLRDISWYCKHQLIV